MIREVPNDTKPGGNGGSPSASAAVPAGTAPVPDAGDGTLRMGAPPVAVPGSSRSVSAVPPDAGDGTLRMGSFPIPGVASPTAFVPDGPVASPLATAFVPDGPVASPLATAFVPDGPVASSLATAFVPDGPVASPLATAFVPDGPDATRIVADGPDVTRAVPDGPVATRDLRVSAGGSLPRFGRFAATAELGSGGMGTVFRARDEVLGRDVAIKALHAQGDLGIRERFVREARAIGAVLHPNILAVYDAGDAAGTPYLVMELAAGGSLRDRIQAGPLASGTVRELGIQMARALAAAHAANIIHRDVKPGNILCAQPGTWKLADFGIARVPDSTLTITGQFLGSPSYAAPESLRAGVFSPASDVYSLGATLYEALAGAPPHGDHDMQSLVRKLEHDAAPLPAKLAVPGPLGAAIMAALARDPAQRPTAEQLAYRLAQTGDATAVRSVPAPRVAAAAGSHRMKLLAAALAAIAIVAVVLAIKSKSEPAAHVPGVTRPSEGAHDGTRSGARADDESTDRAAGERLAPDDTWDDSTGIEPPEPPSPPGAPGMPGMPGAPGMPGMAGTADEAAAPIVVDEYGNQYDEETAKQILEQMERDARSSVGRGRGRGKKKFKD